MVFREERKRRKTTVERRGCGKESVELFGWKGAETSGGDRRRWRTIGGGRERIEEVGRGEERRAGHGEGKWVKTWESSNQSINGTTAATRSNVENLWNSDRRSTQNN